MRRILPPFIAAGLAIGLAAGTALASSGSLRLSWETCDPITQNEDFAGAGSSQIATLVLSVSGADQPNNGHRSVIVIGPDLPEAWRFDDAGCQSGLLEIRHTGVSKACPAFQGGRPLGLYQYSYEEGPGRGKLDITNTYDRFVPQPGQRYTLWQARFDHTFSASGSGNPGTTCRFAGNPLCFRISTELLPPELLLTDGSKAPFVSERDWVTWQDPVNAMNCPRTQERESTWGEVKGMYR